MTNARLVNITRYASLLGGGVVTGGALAVFILELALRRLDGREYTLVRQAEHDYFPWYLGATLGPTLVAMAMLVVLARRAGSPALRPAAAALVLLVLALVVSFAVNAPNQHPADRLERAGASGGLGGRPGPVADRARRPHPVLRDRVRLPRRGGHRPAVRAGGRHRRGRTVRFLTGARGRPPPGRERRPGKGEGPARERRPFPCGPKPASALPLVSGSSR
jgi:hypothetical protein